MADFDVTTRQEPVRYVELGGIPLPLNPLFRLMERLMHANDPATALAVKEDTVEAQALLRAGIATFVSFSAGKNAGGLIRGSRYDEAHRRLVEIYCHPEQFR